MSPENYHSLVVRLDEIKEDLGEIRGLVKETNGRVKELELWRAKLHGAVGTTKILWLIAGGVITGYVIDLLTNG